MSMNLKGKAEGQIVNNNIEEEVVNLYKKTTKNLEKGKQTMTMQGGKVYPMMYKEVLPGEYIESWNIDNIVRIMTPLVPTLDRVYITIDAYFVPHKRVWKNAEKALAAKNSIENRTQQAINTRLPRITVSNKYTQYQLFKETLMSRYGIYNDSGSTTFNILPLRGYVAIYNDFIRNKEYEHPMMEFDTDIPNATEQDLIKAYNANTEETRKLGYTDKDNAYIIKPAPARKSYYTDIRSEIARDNQTLPGQTPKEQSGDTRNAHLDWQTQFQDLKQQATNANKNDWNIIAEMGGTSPVQADRVQHLGTIDYELNYQQITQATPQVEESSPLGTTGSFSYTRTQGNIFNHKEFKQHGYIHILVNLNMDQNFENGIPKELLKTELYDIYRPGMDKKEIQFIYEKEVAAHAQSGDKKTIGFQKPYAEYGRLPTFATGEMRTRRLLKNSAEEPEPITNSQWHNMFMNYNSTIDQTYFNPREYVQTVLARNNVLQKDNITDMYDDPIMTISMHSVTARLPITKETIEGKDLAEKQR